MSFRIIPCGAPKYFVGDESVENLLVLVVASALTPGATKIISEVLHFNEGSELYKLSPPLSQELVGVDFKSASAWLLERDMILIGIESDTLSDSYGDESDQFRDAQQGSHNR